jgi:hypothetical protein
MLLPISKIYWDAFHSVLKQSAESLARDIATTLGEPSAPLLKAIKDNTLNLYLFDELSSDTYDIESMRCVQLIESFDSPSVHVCCNNPVLISSSPSAPTKYCSEHSRTNIKMPDNAKEALYIKGTDGELYIVCESLVYDTKMTLIGRYNEATNKLIKMRQVL